MNTEQVLTSAELGEILKFNMSKEDGVYCSEYILFCRIMLDIQQLFKVFILRV